MIKNIVFDMDGVLIDTEALFMRCWKKLAEKLELPMWKRLPGSVSELQ